MTEGIKYNPHAEYLYYNRACCYSKIKKLDEALNDLKKAIILYPNFIDIIKLDKDLENLYKDSRFISLINKKFRV